MVATLGVAGCQFDRPADVRGIDGQPAQVALTLTIEGAGAGTVQVAPGDFVCSSGTCSRTFDAGSEVTLTGSPASVLDGVASVTGACTSLPCTLNMAGPREVAIEFRRFSCEPNISTCSAGRFTACTADGEYATYVVPNGNGELSPVTLTMRDYTCPLGCHATQAKCADIDTQMELNGALELPAVSDAGRDVVIPTEGSPPGSVMVDTSTWDSTLHEVRVTDTSGQTLRIPAEVVTQPAPAPEILVLTARTFTLRSGSTLDVRGTRALAIVSHYDLLVAGTIDLSAARGTQDTVGPGSFPDSTTTCIGHFTAGVSGGGSNWCSAGSGSNGAARGDTPSVEAPALAGGCPGGRGPGAFQFGGIAGGALGLVSRTKASLAATAVIDLSGGHGWAAPGWATGGGSGGTLIVHAPSLVVANGAVIASRGGSGGAAGPSASAPGQEGPVQGTTGAPGGSCSGCGVGGAGSSVPGCGANGTGSGTALGAGGGGSGVCVAYTLTPPLIPAGTMRSGYSNRTVATRSP